MIVAGTETDMYIKIAFINFVLEIIYFNSLLEIRLTTSFLWCSTIIHSFPITILIDRSNYNIILHKHEFYSIRLHKVNPPNAFKQFYTKCIYSKLKLNNFINVLI